MEVVLLALAKKNGALMAPSDGAPDGALKVVLLAGGSFFDVVLRTGLNEFFVHG